MADIETSFLGMKLRSPVIAGSSSLTGQVKTISDLGKAGAGAVVLKSLFEEQILNEAAREAGKGGIVYGQDDLDGFITYYERKHSIGQYLRLIKESKAACTIPVIASVNAVSDGEWASIAGELAGAGADAVQLNLFVSPFDLERGCERIEAVYAETVRKVKAATGIPVVAKIGSYFTSIPRIVRGLAEAGADAVVLFNRYYAPDLDIEKVALTAAVHSAPTEHVPALRWISLLSHTSAVPLVGATGIHDGQALIKMLLAGAGAVEVVSTLYRQGPRQITTMNQELASWMDARGYADLGAFRGKLAGTDDAQRAALERFQYMKTYGDKD